MTGPDLLAMVRRPVPPGLPRRRGVNPGGGVRRPGGRGGRHIGHQSQRSGVPRRRRPNAERSRPPAGHLGVTWRDIDRFADRGTGHRRGAGVRGSTFTAIPTGGGSTPSTRSCNGAWTCPTTRTPPATWTSCSGRPPRSGATSTTPPPSGYSSRKGAPHLRRQLETENVRLVIVNGAAGAGTSWLPPDWPRSTTSPGSPTATAGHRPPCAPGRAAECGSSAGP